MENFRCLGLIAFGAVRQQLSYLRSAIGNLNWRLAPKMIGHDCYQGGEVIMRVGIAVVSGQINGAEKHIGRVIAGAPNRDATVSLPQKINRHLNAP
jgi:hypothetical protein